jgi:hypothetical protein
VTAEQQRDAFLSCSIVHWQGDPFSWSKMFEKLVLFLAESEGAGCSAVALMDGWGEHDT